MEPISHEILTGKTEVHLIQFRKTQLLVHKEVLAPLDNLFSTARAIRGFDLKIASSFRSYESQKNIWNAKATGQKPIFDDYGQPVDISRLSSEEIAFAILRWSAVPGASRHHWGTDFDFFDVSSVHESYQLKLSPSEYLRGGVFEESNQWLTENMTELGFFRPYSVDKNGIAPEPWHLSFKSLADEYLKAFSFEVFEKHLLKSDFALIEFLRKNVVQIYERFVLI